MNKYMKADEVIALYEKYHYSLATRVSEFGEVLRELPTVDAIEVVRCKDCKHWDDDDCACDNKYFVTADCFCFWGERK